MLDRLPPWLARRTRTAIATYQLYSAIGGEQRAAAFAYYALFSLVPLIALMLAAGSYFFKPVELHNAIVTFVPLGSDGQQILFGLVENLESVRGGASLVSIVILTWTSLRFFHVLVQAVNEAWRSEPIPWWQLPFKNLVMIIVIGSALVLGIIVPAVIQGIRRIIEAIDTVLISYLPSTNLVGLFHILDSSRFFVSALLLFYAFAILYMLAPRRRVRFAQVWMAAMFVAIFLQLVQIAFVSILPHFIDYSKIYGSISSLMLLLMWVYISGQIIILGACLCAVRALAAEATPSTPENSSSPISSP